MGLSDLFSTVYEGFSSALSSPDLWAEAPQGGAGQDTPATGTDEESSDEKEVNQADEKSGDDDAEEGEQSTGESDGDDDEGEEGGEDAEEEEEEEEEEDEPEDIMPKLHEQCAESKQCAPAKHHFDECTERVQGKIEESGKSDEDCVEEFFHLAHCASQCAAPKLWRQLK